MAAEPMACVVVTCGRPELLLRLLESVAAAEDAGLLSRLMVREVGGRADGEAVCRAFAGRLPIEYARQEDSRKTVALNAAVREVGGGLVVFLDDDVRIEPGLFSAYAAAAAAHPNAYFGGPFGVDRPQDPPDWLETYLPPSAVGRPPRGAGRVRNGGDFLGFNWAARAEDVLSCGGYDESLGPGCEVPLGDESFMQRALAAGGLAGVEVPAAAVRHYVPPSRCSPQWALRRAYPGGVTRGLAIARHNPRRPWWRALAAELWRLIRWRGPRNIRPWTRRGRYFWRHSAQWLRGMRAGLADGGRSQG